MNSIYSLPDGQVVDFGREVSPEEAKALLAQYYPDLAAQFSRPQGEASFVKEVGKGFGRGAVAGAESVARGVLSLLPDDTEEPYAQTVKDLASKAREAMAAHPSYEGSTTAGLSEAVGSLTTFLPAMAAGPLAPLLTVGLGAASGAGEAIQRQEAAGVPREAWRTLRGAGIGTTEAIPILHGLGKITGVGQKKAAETALDVIRKYGPEGVKALKQLGKSMLVVGGEEALQEAGSNALQNWLESTYNPARGIWDDTLASAGYGGGAGALVGGIFGLPVARRMRRLAVDETEREQREAQQVAQQPAGIVGPPWTPEQQRMAELDRQIAAVTQMRQSAEAGEIDPAGIPVLDSQLAALRGEREAQAAEHERVVTRAVLDSELKGLIEAEPKVRATIDELTGKQNPTPEDNVALTEALLQESRIKARHAEIQKLLNEKPAGTKEEAGKPAHLPTEQVKALRGEEFLQAYERGEIKPIAGKQGVAKGLVKQIREAERNLAQETDENRKTAIQKSLDGLQYNLARTLGYPYAFMPSVLTGDASLSAMLDYADASKHKPAMNVAKQTRDSLKDLFKNLTSVNEKLGSDGAAIEKSVNLQSKNAKLSWALNDATLKNIREGIENAKLAEGEREQLRKDFADIEKTINERRKALGEVLGVDVVERRAQARAGQAARQPAAETPAPEPAVEAQAQGQQVETGAETQVQEQPTEVTTETQQSEPSVEQLAPTGRVEPGRDPFGNELVEPPPPETTEPPVAGPSLEDQAQGLLQSAPVQPEPAVVARQPGRIAANLAAKPKVEAPARTTKNRRYGSAKGIDTFGEKITGKSPVQTFVDGEHTVESLAEAHPVLQPFVEDGTLNLGKTKAKQHRAITRKNLPTLQAQLAAIQELIDNAPKSKFSPQQRADLTKALNDARETLTIGMQLRSEGLSGGRKAAADVKSERISHEKEIDDEITKIVNQTLQSGEQGKEGRPQSVSVLNPDTRTVDQQAIAELGNAIGLNVYFVEENVEGGKPTEFNGFVLRNVPGFERTVFINVSATDPHLFVMGHEYVHVLRNLDKASYDEFRDLVIETTDSKGNNRYSKYLKAVKENPDAFDLDKELEIEEFVGDNAGLRFIDDAFWKKLKERADAAEKAGNDSVSLIFLRNIVGTLRNILDKLKEALSPRLREAKLSKLIKDFDAIDNELLDLITQSAEGSFDNLEDSGVALFGTSKAAQHGERVLFSIVSEASPELARAARTANALVGPITDPAQSIGTQAVNWFNRNKGLTWNRLMTQFRTAAAWHTAPMEEDFGGQHTRELQGQAVSQLNAVGTAAQVGAVGQLSKASMVEGLVQLNQETRVINTKENTGHLTVAAVSEDLARDGLNHVDSSGKKSPLPLASMSQFFSAYMYARRIRSMQRTLQNKRNELEIANRVDEKRHRAKLEEDIRRLEVEVGQFSEESIRDGLALGEQFKNFPEYADRMYQIFKNNVDLLEQSGRISKEVADAFRGARDYAPMYREDIMESTFDGMLSRMMANRDSALMRKQGRKGLSDIDPLPELSGEPSSKPLSNIFTNTARFNQWAIAQAARTLAGRTMIQESSIWNEGKPARRLQHPKAGDPLRTVTIYENGELVGYELEDPLDVVAFKGLQPVLRSEFGKKFANILRRSVTLMPGFSLGQIPQDAMRAAFASGTNKPFRVAGRVITGFGRALSDSFTGKYGDVVGEQMARAGMSAGMVDFSDHGAIDIANSLAGLSRAGMFTKLLHGLERISGASDLAQRRAVYEQVLKDTGDTTRALVAAREVINFNRTGASATIAALRQMVPFMGAYIQGIDVMYRAMRGMGQHGMGGDPKALRAAQRRFLGFVGKLAVPSLAYAFMMMGDDEYEGMTEFERDRYLLIPGTRGIVGEQSLRIPIPMEIGFIFKSLPERSMRLIMSEAFAEGTTEQQIQAVGRAIGRAFAGGLEAYSSPNVLPQFVKPLIELQTNHVFLTDNPIEGLGMEKLMKRERWTENTSEIAKAASRLLSYEGYGLSPVQIDHIIRSSFGLTGVAINAWADAAVNTLSPNRPAMQPSKVAKALTLGTFVAPDIPQGFNEEYYRLREQVDKAHGTWLNALNFRDPQTAAQYTEQFRQELGVKPVFNRLEQIKEQNRRVIKQIQNQIRMGNLTPQEGREQIDAVKKAEQQMLKGVVPTIHRAMYGGTYYQQ